MHKTHSLTGIAKISSTKLKIIKASTMALFKYSLVLFWTSLAMICGFLLFYNGFFLSKNVTMLSSICSKLYTDSFNFENPLSSATECLKPRARIVMLIVDALKYEFAIKFSDKDATGTYHRNKLPIISETLERYPKNSKLFKFIADPPTTTMQRLKALTTGTLPTFIEISNNFGADNIEEDNFIDQNKDEGNVIMGDNTWNKLYPGKFIRDHTVYSFDTFDLDTVDISVQKQIFNEIKNKDWSLLIAHILGIDHCGHTFGMNHPQMSRKLNETNYFISDIIKEINKDNDDTVLFIIGDHGMTESGDHGGESSDEIDAAMFVYSTLPLMSSNKNLNIDWKSSSIKQISIVPTVSVILGLPIPYSNIGSLIIEALPTKESIENVKSHDFNFVLHSLWRNIFQIQSYLDDYSSKNSFTKHDKLKLVKQIYNELFEQIKVLKLNRDLKDFVNKANKYFEIVREICYTEWVQFDNNLMARGMLVSFCSILSLFITITGLVNERIHSILQSSFLSCLFVLVLISLGLSVVLYYLEIIIDLTNTLLFSCGLSCIICFAILLIQNWDCISDSWYKQSKHRKCIVNYLSRFVFIGSVFGVFSNSYILEENTISAFLVITMFCFIFYLIRNKDFYNNTFKKGKGLGYSSKKLLYISTPSMLVIVVCILIRVTNFYWRYRPEFINRIKKSETNNTLVIMGKIGSVTSHREEIYFVIFAIASTVMYYIVFKIWLQKCGNLSGYSAGAYLNKYLTRIVLVFLSCYWILKLKVCEKWKVKHLHILPLSIYVSVIFAVCIIFYLPLSVFLLPKENKIKIKRDEATVPKLYEKFKSTLYMKQEEKNQTPIVYGLGTVFSACFLSLSMFLCLLYILLLGFVIAPSVIIMNIACIVLLYVSAMDRVCNASNIGEMVHVPNIVVLCWFLLAEYFFFATGHELIFSSIHWDAGFIGIDGSLSSKFIMFLRGILIVINTFGSHIILGITLPLLVITPFTLRFVFPYLTKTSKIPWEDMKRGELLLYDNSNLFHSELFLVYGKYILFHACKVFICMLAVTVHNQHLMVWAIFAPKFIFEGSSFFITIGSILISQLLLLRIESKVEKCYSQIFSLM